MVHIQEMKSEEITNVLEWNLDTKDFLTQWSNLSYPLTREQYEERIASKDFMVYSIYDNATMIGTIQIFKRDYERKSAMVGCFLINPEMRSKGLGEQAMKATVHKVFAKQPEGLGFDIVRLGVYDFNKGAKRCYEKCGFKTVEEEIRPNGWLCYMMEIHK